MTIKGTDSWLTFIYLGLTLFLIVFPFSFPSGNGYQNVYHGPAYFIYIYLIMALLLLLGSLTPFFIYLRYGKEPKISYDTRYEVDLPTDDPPAIVNAICGNSSKKVGTPDMDGFKATIMDLIDRNYLLLKDMGIDNKNRDSSCSIFLEVNPNNDLTTLWDFEAEVLNFLKEYEQNGVISVEMISKSLNYHNDADFFKFTYEKWVDEVKQTLLADGKLKEAFLRKGDKYLKIFGISGLIVAVVILFFMIGDPVPTAYCVSISSIILGFSALISILMPEKIAGRWTPYGKEYYAQWHSFKNYIKDYSLIKEYPPESVNVWNKYLVYATALGDAKGVRKAMELSLPENMLSETDLYMFHYYSSPVSLFTNAIKTALESD